jgi:hypothetical protein
MISGARPGRPRPKRRSIGPPYRFRRGQEYRGRALSYQWTWIPFGPDFMEAVLGDRPLAAIDKNNPANQFGGIWQHFY